MKEKTPPVTVFFIVDFCLSQSVKKKKKKKKKKITSIGGRWLEVSDYIYCLEHAYQTFQWRGICTADSSFS